MSGGRSDAQNGQPEGVVGGVAEFVNDVASLAELQAKLAALDVREAAGKAALPLGLAVVGAAVLAGCIPVAVAGVALLIAPAVGVSFGLSLLMTALVLMVTGGVVAAVAARRVGHSLDVLRRSQDELQRNLSWIRTVLVHSGRSSPPGRRW